MREVPGRPNATPPLSGMVTGLACSHVCGASSCEALFPPPLFCQQLLLPSWLRADCMGPCLVRLDQPNHLIILALACSCPI